MHMKREELNKVESETGAINGLWVAIGVVAAVIVLIVVMKRRRKDSAE
jgi:LPXTG-motif cell wall-anchored protein